MKCVKTRVKNNDVNLTLLSDDGVSMPISAMKSAPDMSNLCCAFPLYSETITLSADAAATSFFICFVKCDMCL